MNALDQYIDLYTQYGEALRAHSPEALNRPRAAALDTLRRLGRLPKRGDEGYQLTDVEAMLAPDMGVNVMRVAPAADPRGEVACALPGLGSLNALLVNDTFVAGRGLADALPAGVEVMSLARAAELYPDDVMPGVAPAGEAAVALNSLLVQDGVYIRVAPGVRLDTPIQVLGIFSAASPVLAVRRVRISMGDGASASVLMCDHPRRQQAYTASSRVVECTLGRGAALDCYDLEESGPGTGRISVFAARQDADSRLSLTSAFLSGGCTRNEVYVSHTAPGCHTALGGMVIAGAGQQVDNSTRIVHSQPHCTSEQLFKYALFDDACGAFGGIVTVDHGAVHTDARQTNRNLLASPSARMYAQPQLIINCDEVKASHGATTGRLDDDALFYMRSRGIPEAEARMMLTNAFLTDVLDSIGIEALRERLRHLVDKRLRGCGTSCDKCNLPHELRR